jgi:hypothetical protein
MQDEIYEYADQFKRLLSEAAPHRADDAYPRQLKIKGRVVSPMPRNLQLHGQVLESGEEGGYTVKSGYEPAPYALYANAKGRWREGDHGPHYIERSIEKFRSFLDADGWEEE